MSECDATVGQVAKGTTASFALGPHGASVCGRAEHALPGVGVVGVVFGLVAVDFVPVGGVFGGRIVPFAPAVEVFGVVGGVFGLVALGLVPADGVGVDEIGVFGALGTVFGCVGGCADGVCGAFGGVCGVFEGRIVPFAPVGRVFGLVALGLVSVGAVFVPVFGRSDGVCGGCAFAVGVFGSVAAAVGSAVGETGAKRSASDGAGGADVDEATEEGAAERRLC